MTWASPATRRCAPSVSPPRPTPRADRSITVPSAPSTQDVDGRAAEGVAGREIAWDGFHNARDLGGLPTRDGRTTRRGALVRSADVRFVTEAGWRAAVDAGVRTVLDLRNDDEVPAHPPYARYGIDRVRVALDGVEDVEFWRYLDEAGLNGTPLYYRPFLERKPERCAQAVTAVARARPGAVVYHCGAGRDRTGLLTLLLLTLLLLALAGVEPEAVAADHDLGAEPLRALFARSGRADEGPAVERLLAARGTTVAEAILSTLDGFDAEAYLLAAGVSAADLAAVRARLLG